MNFNSSGNTKTGILLSVVRLLFEGMEAEEDMDGVKVGFTESCYVKNAFSYQIPRFPDLLKLVHL